MHFGRSRTAITGAIRTDICTCRTIDRLPLRTVLSARKIAITSVYASTWIG